MSITITTNEARQAYEALLQIGNNKLPNRVSFWVARLTAKLKSDYEASDEVRKNLITEIGEDHPNITGQKWIRNEDQPRVEAYNKAWKPIGEEKVTYEAPTLPESAFEGVSIEPRFVHALLPFLTE